MAQRLYLNSDLAAMAGKLPQNIGQPNRSMKWPVPDFVSGTGDGQRLSYTEATARAWCDRYGVEFVPMPDVTPDRDTP